VKNAKPRLSSRPGPKIGKLSEEYLRVRNAQMRTKNLTAEMVLAERRGELIEKRLVERQAAWLLLAMRQKLLGIPQTYCRRLLNVGDIQQVAKILKEMSLSILSDARNLPSAVNPGWLDTWPRTARTPARPWSRTARSRRRGLRPKPRRCASFARKGAPSTDPNRLAKVKQDGEPHKVKADLRTVGSESNYGNGWKLNVAAGGCQPGK
jgi:hypothetical protein